ncbi:MAG: type II toxin-antitoxin system HicA family toxin [Spirochaetaceae bacterium]|nr:MAG: type II toxin-antitoxin system HicA family toxin [Spirochaetaceae bacterium]
MSSHRKLIQRVLNNPNTVSFRELDRILTREGWVKRGSKSGSSHHTYSMSGNETIITVPFKRPHVSAHYVRRVIELLSLEEKYGE